MKKLAMIIVALVMTITASAQFEAGTMYGNASLSGLNLSYNSTTKCALNVNAKVGYCVADNLMLLATGGIDTQSAYTNLSIGVGGRYYIIQNGIYLGANVMLKQVDSERHNDFMPGVEIGYAFFINRHVTVEPAIYYDQSFKNHSDYSTVGFRIGLGIYM